MLQDLAQSYERGRIEYENSQGADKLSLGASLPLVDSVACIREVHSESTNGSETFEEQNEGKNADFTSRMKSTDSISSSEGELETSDEEEEQELDDEEESLIDDSSNYENVESLLWTFWLGPADK